MEPWRSSATGISVALRVTPRAACDEIEGIAQQADGRSVLKVRVRAVAGDGAANRAVLLLMATSLGVPQAKVRLVSGATSRMKQIAVDGDPTRLGEALRRLTTATG